MPIEEIKCKQCGKKFYGISTRAMFCSAKCKQKNFRLNKLKGEKDG